MTDKTLAKKYREWLAKIRPYNDHPMKFDPAKSALLVVDMQEFFLDPSSPTFTCGAAAILPSVEKMIQTF